MPSQYWKASTWESIMSTSERISAGLPSIEELSRLANEFFSATPSAAAGLPSPAATAAPAAPLGEISPSINLPSESQLQSWFVPGPLNFSQPGAFLQAAARAAVGGGSALYFMDRAAAQAPQAATPALATAPGLNLPGMRTDTVYSLVSVAHPAFDVNLIRRDFPILEERVQGRSLVWLDNAATTQKPRSVIDRLQYFYEHENSNIHRAAHELAARATDAYEGAREKVRQFLNAASTNEIVFVRGATEAINLVAQSWGRQNIGKDDEIIISWLEHHANIVPWQQLAAEKGARIRVIPVDDRGQILLDEYAKLLGPKTKIVSFTQVSNALGTITPAKMMVDLAHSAGAKVLVDGAQAVSHMPIDVRALDSDWYVFSGHKVFAPTGIGVLYGKEALLNEMPPWQGGGNMITDVTFERTLFQPAPGRFEAGTGNIADAVGLGAAIDYVTQIGMSVICAYEQQLLSYATKRLGEIPGLRLIGTAADKAGVLSFVLEGHRSEDVGSALSRDGIAVRAGHHCAQPILRRFGVESTVRPSLAFYNNTADIDALIGALQRLTGGAGSRAAIPRGPAYLP
jgi:cysteine desulfurase/selenocysteine lyase